MGSGFVIGICQTTKALSEIGKGFDDMITYLCSDFKLILDDVRGGVEPIADKQLYRACVYGLGE